MSGGLLVNAFGQNGLGWMYENGYGVDKYQQAIQLYRQAARQNDEKMVKEFAQRALKRLQAE